jgi:hypothetical protein
MSSICSRVIARSYSLLVVYRCAGKKFTVDATTSQSVLELHSTLSTSFPTMRPSISFIRKTPLPNVITLRSPTPMIPSINLVFFSSSSLEHHPALRAFPVDQMVTFTAALLQTRQTAVFLHLLSSLVHSLRLLACLLLASLIACRFSTSLSPRCSNFASAIHNIHAVSHAVFHLFEFQPLSLLVLHPMCGKEFHGGRHNESLCLTSTPPCRLHFRRRPSIIFIRPTPLPNVITLRNRTPLSSISSHFLVFFAVHLLSNSQSAL